MSELCRYQAWSLLHNFFI